MRAYAHTRSVNIAVANSIARAPPVVPTPHINDTTRIAAARAAAKAMRGYSLTRATNHGLLLNAAHAPPVVPTPALHAASHQ